MNSSEYEKFICDIQQVLLNAQGLETIRVQHDVKLMGISGQKHQIDVYWEYRLAGITHHVAIECKHHSRNVEIGMVRNFWGVLDDVIGLRGVIVSPVGFASGAETYARSKGIGLKVIRQAQNADYDGRIQNISINIHMVLPINLRLEIVPDENWYAKNITTERELLMQEMSNISGLLTEGLAIEERNTGEEIILANLANYLPITTLEDSSTVNEWEKIFDQGFLVQPGKPELKLSKIKVSYQISSLTNNITFNASDIAEILIKDAKQGTLLFIDEHGHVFGDLAAEGILKT